MARFPDSSSCTIHSAEEILHTECVYAFVRTWSMLCRAIDEYGIFVHHHTAVVTIVAHLRACNLVHNKIFVKRDFV